MTMWVLYELVETYWCFYDQSSNVSNCTWFVSYSHLTNSDVQISSCRHVAFLYSAAIFFERTLHAFFFLIIVSLQIFQFLYTGWCRSYLVFMFRSWKAVSSDFSAVFVRELINCERYWFLKAASVFCNVVPWILIERGNRFRGICYLWLPWR
jgi:hypothetical protein